MSKNHEFAILRASILISGDTFAWDDVAPHWYQGGGWCEADFWEELWRAYEDGRLGNYQRRCSGYFSEVWPLLRPQILSGQFDGTICAWSQLSA